MDSEGGMARVETDSETDLESSSQQQQQSPIHAIHAPTPASRAASEQVFNFGVQVFNVGEQVFNFEDQVFNFREQVFIFECQVFNFVEQVFNFWLSSVHAIRKVPKLLRFAIGAHLAKLRLVARSQPSTRLRYMFNSGGIV